VSGALGAIDTASGGGEELGIAFVEWCLFEQQEYVMLYPILEMPDGKDDALGLPCRAAPILTKAASESGFLLGWLELRQ
jgi:hypothetical protein